MDRAALAVLVTNLHAQFPLLKRAAIEVVAVREPDAAAASAALHVLTTAEAERLRELEHAIEKARGGSDGDVAAFTASVGASLLVVKLVSRLQANVRKRNAEKAYAEVWSAAMVKEDEEMRAQEHADMMELLGMMDERHDEERGADAALVGEARAQRSLAIDCKVEDHASLYVPTPNTREADELDELRERQTRAWVDTVAPAATSFFAALGRATGGGDERVPVEDAIASCSSMRAPLRRLAQRSIAEVLHQADANGDGYLTSEEWCAFVKRIAWELPVEAMRSLSDEMAAFAANPF